MKKFYFFLVAMLIGAISASSAAPTGETYVINGVGGVWSGWNQSDFGPDRTFVETSPGVYELTISLSGSNPLIVAMKGGTADWNKKVRVSGVVKADGEYTCSPTGGDNFTLGEAIENCHIIMNFNTNKIKFEGQAKANQFDVVYMVGDFGSGWDVSTTAYPLAAVDGEADTYEGTYTITGTAAQAAYFYTVPKCGDKVLQLTGSDVVIDANNSGKEYTLATGDKSFACVPGTYKFRVVATQEANSAKVSITQTDAPKPTEYTIYWDNTTANWDIVYAYVADAEGGEAEAMPGLELSDLGKGIWSATVPADYPNVTFNNGDAEQYGPYEVQHEYIYGPDQPGMPYEEPVDYSSWYVNVFGVFNGWGDNGVHPVNGISTHKNLMIGTSEFKVKIWNGEDIYYSTGGAVPTGQWVKINGNANPNMTVAGATAGESFDVQFNCKTNEIFISKIGDIDYTGWYFNVCGDFNAWSKDSGKEFSADGTAVNIYDNVNTAFKVVIWDGASEIYYAKTGTLVANEWNDINANQENMVLPEELRTGSVKFTFNNVTKELKVEPYTSGVDSIETEENVAPVYYNLQGVRVDNPSNGLYIVVRGSKVAKELVK